MLYYEHIMAFDIKLYCLYLTFAEVFKSSSDNNWKPFAYYSDIQGNIISIYDK